MFDNFLGENVLMKWLNRQTKQDELTQIEPYLKREKNYVLELFLKKILCISKQRRKVDYLIDDQGRKTSIIFFFP